MRLRVAIRFRGYAAPGCNAQQADASGEFGAFITDRAEQAQRVEIAVGPPVVAWLAEGERVQIGDGFGIAGHARGREQQIEGSDPRCRDQRGDAEARGAALRGRLDARCFAAGGSEIDGTRDGVGAIFDRHRAFHDADLTYQSGRQDAEIDPAVPWHRKRRTIEKHLGLAFFGAAHTGYGFAARVVFCGHAGKAAKRIRHGARLTLYKALLVRADIWRSDAVVVVFGRHDQRFDALDRFFRHRSGRSRHSDRREGSRLPA